MVILLAVRPRAGRGRSQDTATEHRNASGLAIALGLVLALSSCRPAVPAPVDFERRVSELETALEGGAGPLAPGAVRVQLAFGAGADLDLYVTDGDPRSNETVYFAKHTTRGGGRLLRDARCGDAAPRSDAALFDSMPTGGLRIGVDYHESCGGRPEPEPFALEIAHGDDRELHRGIAHPGHFEDRFLLYAPVEK